MKTSLWRIAIIALAFQAKFFIATAAEINSDIKIGNVMPYTGRLAAFGVIGRTEAAYYRMINDRGGISGHKIHFTSYDDGSDIKRATELTTRLIFNDHVIALMGSFGTPGNLIVRGLLNRSHVPQLFVASGSDDWSKPNRFPWTMGWSPAFRIEGRIYANYIQAYYPERKIGVLWQNNHFGRDLIAGLEAGLAGDLDVLVADLTFEDSDQSVNTQIDQLRDVGVGVVAFDGSPRMAAAALKHMSDIGWHPVFLLNNAAASIADALAPVGLTKAVGVVTAGFLKDPADRKWANDEGMTQYFAFMDSYFPGGRRDDLKAVFGYAVAQTVVHVLERCGSDFSSANIMRQAASLDGYKPSVLLPGIILHTTKEDYRPIEQMHLLQFDGISWHPIGAVFDDAFTVKDDLFKTP